MQKPVIRKLNKSSMNVLYERKESVQMKKRSQKSVKENVCRNQLWRNSYDCRFLRHKKLTKKVSRKGKMEAFNKMICRESQVYLIKAAVGKELFQKNKYQKDLRVWGNITWKIADGCCLAKLRFRAWPSNFPRCFYEARKTF